MSLAVWAPVGLMTGVVAALATYCGLYWRDDDAKRCRERRAYLLGTHGAVVLLLAADLYVWARRKKGGTRRVVLDLLLLIGILIMALLLGLSLIPVISQDTERGCGGVGLLRYEPLVLLLVLALVWWPMAGHDAWAARVRVHPAPVLGIPLAVDPLQAASNSVYVASKP